MQVKFNWLVIPTYTRKINNTDYPTYKKKQNPTKHKPFKVSQFITSSKRGAMSSTERCITKNADSEYFLCFLFHMVYTDQYCKE